MKKLIMMSVAATLLLALANEGMAACNSGFCKVNLVQRLSNGTYRIYVEKETFNGAGDLLWYVTSNADIALQASDAVANTSTARVVGNAAGCGNSNTATHGFGGTITEFLIYRNR